jgi:putative sterol carrier protein
MANQGISPAMQGVIAKLNERTKDMNTKFVCQFHFGEEGSYVLDLSKEPNQKMAPGIAEKPTVTVTTSLETFLEMLSGKVPPMAAFAMGKVKASGDILKMSVLSGVIG